MVSFKLFFSWVFVLFCSVLFYHFVKNVDLVTGRETVEERETPAQAEARANASMKIQREKVYGVWDWVKQVLGVMGRR